MGEELVHPVRHVPQEAVDLDGPVGFLVDLRDVHLRGEGESPSISAEIGHVDGRGGPWGLFSEQLSRRLQEMTPARQFTDERGSPGVERAQRSPRHVAEGELEDGFCGGVWEENHSQADSG